MAIHFDWYTISALIASFITFGVGIIGLTQRSAPGSRELSVLMFTICGWIMSSFFMVTNTDNSARLFFFNIRFLFVCLTVIPYLAMILQHLGKTSMLNIRNLGLLLIMPIITQFMTWTNGIHGHFVDMQSGVTGFFFWIHMVYNFTMLIIGIALLFQSVLHSHHIFRKQAVLMLVGAVIPIVTSFFEAYRFFSPAGKSLIPVSFALTGVIFAWALLRYRLFDLIPVARSVLVETMRDGIMVLDNSNKLADINNSAVQIVSSHYQAPETQLIGMPITEILKKNQSIITLLVNDDEGHMEIEFRENGTTSFYELDISMLRDRNGMKSGKLLTWRDITQRIHDQREKSNLATTLQHALNDVKELSELLPICASCKKIRDDDGYWHQVESYLKNHKKIEFSHGICPQCVHKLYPDFEADGESNSPSTQ